MSCTVTETLNGEWELTLVHDIDEHGKWTRLSEGCILRAPVPAAMTPSVDLVTQQYQTSTYDVQIPWANLHISLRSFRFDAGFSAKKIYGSMKL